MSQPEQPNQSGQYEARYLAFLETTLELRPSLHRYCARMTGSVMDGEDVVQEALFEAYRKLDKFDDSRALKPWLFRIAHNRCIDFIRKRGVRLEADTAAVSPEFIEPEESAALGLDGALEHLVISLPPMERACVLLKDVLDYSLEEIAALVDSTVGGVKAALHRGRVKIKASPDPRKIPVAGNPELVQLLELYVERFNRRDWNGVRELISADARLEVVARYAGNLSASPYFSRYEQQPDPCKLAVTTVDGEPVVIVLERVAGLWNPRSPVRLKVVNQRITSITDYYFCPWILEAANA
ncbi:MAG: sigma-70 family RNA polymerase sigma factor [Limisphaerales bacterium]